MLVKKSHAVDAQLQDLVFRLAELLLNFSDDAEAVLADVLCAVLRECEVGQISAEEVEQHVLQETVREVRRRIQSKPTGVAASSLHAELSIRYIAPSEAERDLTDLLRQTLSLLPQEYREVYVMHDVAGFPVERVASLVSLSENQTRQILHRARMMVWRTMRRDGDMDALLAVGTSDKAEPGSKSESLM